MYLSNDKALVEWRATAPSNPWQFLLQLEPILNTETPSEVLVSDILRMFRRIEGVAAGWAARVAADGSMAPWCSGDLDGDDCRHPAHIMQTLASEAWRQGESAIVRPPYAPAGAGDEHRSAAVIILRGRIEPHGVLVVHSRIAGFFEDNWPCESLSHLGALIGSALERRIKDQALQRVQLLYRTLLSGDVLLLQARSEKNILRGICALLVQSGLFLSSWVNLPDASGAHRNIARQTGRRPRNLARLIRKFAPASRFQMLNALAWQSEKTEIANDYRNDPRFAPWHEAARQIGFLAAAALPIFRAGKCWAILAVHSAETNFFDAELQRLLERLAGMVGHALDELDLKRELRAEREAQSRIARLDTLTGLPNRLALYERLAAEIKNARRQNKLLGIGLFDLDDFKQVNANWGHGAGDTLLRVIGERLSRTLRQADFVARLGGDEFALILEGWSLENVSAFCLRLHEAINAPVILPGGQSVSISFSIGFTLFPPDNADAGTLLRHADSALLTAKAAKQKGGKFWNVFEDGQSAGNGAHYQRGLLRAGGLTLHYQPVIDTLSGEIVSVEALARLSDGKKLLAPAAFLKQLTLDDRHELFRQVTAQGLAQLRLWDGEGRVLGLSVNVDAQILLLDSTLQYLTASLEKAGIPPRRLTLEILETHEFMDLQQAGARLAAIRATGIKIALDDLGAGYSSILKLRDLPLDVIKLDRAFIAGLRQRPDDLMFISVFRTLSKTLGMEMVVEGVETADILDALRMLGAGMVQGFGIAKPMPGDRLSQWMRHYRPEAAKIEPVTLLGAYAVHLSWQRMFQSERTHTPMLKFLRQHKPYSLHGFFAANGLTGSDMAGRYEILQNLMNEPANDRSAISVAASRFRAALRDGLAAQI